MAHTYLLHTNHNAAIQCIYQRDHGQEDLLNSNNVLNKQDLSDLMRGMIVVCKQAALSISHTADALILFYITMSRVHGKWPVENISGAMQKYLVDDFRIEWPDSFKVIVGQE